MSRAQEIADLLSGVTITTADNLPQLTLKSTDADGGRGPDLVLTRDSASPADGDAIGFISWTADNDAGADHAFCGIEVLASDVSDGSEDATWQLFTQVAGTSRSRLSATPTETVFNEDSVDVDFRVEGNGDANLLFVDAGNDRIGIGEESPNDYYSNSLVLKVPDEGGITIAVADTAAHRSYLCFADDDSGSARFAGYLAYDHNNDNMEFGTGTSTRARIDSSGTLLVGTATTAVNSSASEAGFSIQSSGILAVARSGGDVASFNRKTNDGTVIQIHQAGNVEGTISVSGSTVSYNGGHISRFSQATDGNRIDGLVKGTVMTNLDQMAKWHHEEKAATYYIEDEELPVGKKVGDEKTPAVAAYDEDNEQLNCMAVSSVEGDANVAGVFVNWDDDDKDHTSDMNVAMTGDMVIRIAQGTTVARGDLLMSAGDGTAKPQDDDIVRSKTIAKVTSTTVSKTYDDGTYLVPCVLMAC